MADKDSELNNNKPAMSANALTINSHLGDFISFFKSIPFYSLGYNSVY
jgi:hypothetical protein